MEDLEKVNLNKAETQALFASWLSSSPPCRQTSTSPPFGFLSFSFIFILLFVPCFTPIVIFCRCRSILVVGLSPNMVDPAIAIGVIGLIATAYDKCEKAYAGCKVMAHFSLDMQKLWRRLEGHWTVVHLLMECNTAQLQNPPDPSNENHPVTKSIRTQLSELAKLFARCEKLIAAQLKESDVRLSSIAPGSEYSRTSVECWAAGSLMPPSDEGGTDDFKRTRSSAGRLHGWRHILRKPFKRKDKKSEAGLPGSATAVTDTELDTLGDQALNPEDSSILGPLRSALPLTGVDDITTSTSNDDLTRLQKETSLWIHIKWAHHIRDELEKCIQDMGITVDILQKILTLRDLKRPQEVLQPKSTPSLTSRKAPRDQEWIKDLHLALARLQKQSPHPPRTLSLALLEDGVELWEQAKEDQPDLHLQENGMMVWLQLEDKDQPALSTFLMIETTDAWSSKAYSAAPLPTLADLSQPSPSTAETENRSYFQTWGTLPSLRDSPLTHTVFAETSQWQRKFTLRDIVQRPDAATMLTRRTLTALTQQLLLGYRRLMLLTYTCSNLRSDNIAYYRPAGTEIDLTDPDWLLHPYMTCGFGSSAPERRPGVQSGPLKDPEAAIVEIGLVLFQLGSQRVVEYDTRTAKVMLPTLRRAKREALNSLNVVEGSHGAKFADVVSACLQAKASNALDVTEAALATLTGLKDEIDGADEVTWYSEDIEFIDVEKAEEKKYVEKDGMGKAEVSKVEVGKDEVEKAEGLR